MPTESNLQIWVDAICTKLEGSPGVDPAVLDLARSLYVDVVSNSQIVRTRKLDENPNTKFNSWRGKLHTLNEYMPVNSELGDGYVLTHIEKIRERNAFKLIFDRPQSQAPRFIARTDVGYNKLKNESDKYSPIGKVVIIQHSGASTNDLCEYFLSVEAEVELYLQDPLYACNRRQREKVRATAENIPNYIKEVPNRNKLRVYTYTCPASLRAVKIDDKLLAVGWYTYHQSSKIVRPRETGIDLLGHNRPMIVVERGREEFEVLNAMFTHVHEAMSKYRRRAN